MMNKINKLVLYCDGASRGNPGPGAYGYVIYGDDEELARGYETLGAVTNNIAEYSGLVMGLKHCREYSAHHITIKADSELMIRQLSGRYKVKAPGLIPLFEEAKGLLKSYKHVDLVHIPREENKLADQLANLALDRRR